jgi:hypothetical protein
MVAQGVAQLRRHPAGIAGACEQVIKTGQQFVAAVCG